MPPVVFLHGFPQNIVVVAPPDRCRRRRRIPRLAFDQRGYSSGARPSARRDYAYRCTGGDVLAVADTRVWTVSTLSPRLGCHGGWVHRRPSPGAGIRTLTAVPSPTGRLRGRPRGGDPDRAERSSYIGVFARRAWQTGAVGRGRVRRTDCAPCSSASGWPPTPQRFGSSWAAMLEPVASHRRSQLVPGHVGRRRRGRGQDLRAHVVRVVDARHRPRSPGGRGHRPVGERALAGSRF